jgi:hypothetical protein
LPFYRCHDAAQNVCLHCTLLSTDFYHPTELPHCLMGCYSSCLNVPPPYQGPESTRMNLVTHTLVESTSSPSVLETSPAAPLFRSRGQTRSVHESKNNNEDPSPRRRVVSAPRAVHPLTLSSSQNPRPDAQVVVGSGRSGVGPSNRGKSNAWLVCEV